MAPVHDRMPVILHPGDYGRWLDRDSDPSCPQIDLLRLFPADEMEAFEVSKDLGNAEKIPRAADSRRHQTHLAPGQFWWIDNN